MSSPVSVQIIPVRGAIARHEKTRLDAAIRVVVPEAEGEEGHNRRPVNIGLVIDCSGSMQGIKLQYAIQAAHYAVDQLRATDCLSVVTYNDTVRTIFKAASPRNKEQVKQAMSRISAGGMTALHAGWIQGGIEVSEALQKEYMNRVILLSDGQANVGETDQATIEKQVRGLSVRGVSTSTVGVGQDYNEDLMSAMARGGSGNYWFIRTPQQLPAIFGQELEGLTAVIGKNVELQITPRARARIVKVHNELASVEETTWRLSELRMGQTVDILVQFEIDAGSDRCSVCDVTLRWDDTEEQDRLQADASLAVEVVEESELSSYPVNADVQEQVALFETGRMKEAAVELFDHGKVDQAKELLKRAKAGLQKYPRSPLLEAEMASFEELDRYLDAKQYALYRKTSHYQSYGFSHGHFHSQLHYRLCGGPVIGDITRPPALLNMPVDAIVNSSDNPLSASGVLSSAVHRAAGPKLLEECRAIGWCDYGQARITRGYDLPVGWVIHTVCPMWLGGVANELQLLRSCYLSILKLAEKNNIRTLTIPAIGTGAMRFPPEVAAENAFEVVGMYLSQSRMPAAVLFVCHDETTLHHYRAAFAAATGIT